jgi:hypothetical protein
VLYAMRVSKKKSASGLPIEFIATCSEVTCSPCCLTYSYALALFAFNVGVETGQLMFIAVVLGALRCTKWLKLPVFV